MDTSYPSFEAAIVRAGAVSPLVERLHGDMMKAMGNESPNIGCLDVVLFVFGGRD